MNTHEIYNINRYFNLAALNPQRAWFITRLTAGTAASYETVKEMCRID